MIEPTEILPFVPVKIKYQKHELVSFKLRLDPDNNDSTTFEKSIPIIKGDEEVREVVNFRRNLVKVWTGMNATNATQKHALVLRIVTDTAEAAYLHGLDKMRSGRHIILKQQAYDAAIAAGQTAAQAATARDAVARPDMSVDDIHGGINYMTEQLVPKRSLAIIKRWLRRKCRKTMDMTIRSFYTHLHRINDDEIPELPPNYDITQSLTQDELLDIILYAKLT